MTVTVSKPQLNLREELSALKKKSGIKGEELLRANTTDEVYSALNPIMFRNLLLNGSFDIWQRGTTFSGAVFYADRWGAPGSGMSGSRVTNDCPYSLSQYAIQVTADNTGYAQLYQRLEGVHSTAGKTVTFSFWGKSSQAGSFRIAMFRNFGSGGSTSDTQIDTAAVASFSAANTWQRFTITILVPSLSGKTIGVNSFVQIGMGGEGTSTAGRTFTWCDVQLEIGNTATPFERRPIYLEDMLCKRYYRRFKPNVTRAPLCQGSAIVRSGYTNFAYGAIIFDAMRTTPSFSWGGSIGYETYAGAGYSIGTISDVSAEGISATGARIRWQKTTGNWATEDLIVAVDNDGTGWIAFDAEYY